MNASMTTDRLDSILFGEGRELINIKFFPGTDRGLTASQLRDAAADALEAVFKGGCKHQPPVTGKKASRLEDL